MLSRRRAAAGRTPAAKPAAAKPVPARPAAAKEITAAVPADGFIAPRSIYRVLAPGVLEPIARAVISDETVSPHDVTEIATQDSTFTWAKDVPFHQDVWMLDFEFKPMRMIWVNVPATEGRMERKLVWYMVYKVTNSGQCLHPMEDDSQEFYEGNRVYKLTAVDKPVRFIPGFTMEVHNRLKDETPGSAKVYRTGTFRLRCLRFGPGKTRTVSSSARSRCRRSRSPSRRRSGASSRGRTSTRGTSGSRSTSRG